MPGFNLVFVQNTGVSFGMLGGMPWWSLVILALVICGWLSIQMLRTRRLSESLASRLIIGGAPGNLFVRLAHRFPPQRNVVLVRGDSGFGSLMPLPVTRLLWSGLAVFAGALAVLSLPPYSILAVVPLSYGLLFLLVQGSSPVRAFLAGWLFGVGYFVAGLSWIAESFLVDVERFGALALPAVAGLSVLLAIFPAIAMATFSIIRRRGLVSATALSVVFAACWSGGEWLRGHVLTGFPWNLAAYAATEFATLRQPAAWVGSYGLSFLVILVAVLPAQALISRRRWTFLSLAMLLIGGLWLFADTRTDPTISTSTGVSIRIVQGNFAQREKWAPGAREAAVSRYLRLSAQGGTVDVVLWPETAFPGFLDEDEDARRRIQTDLPSGSVLLTGAPDRVDSQSGPRSYNTIQVYGPEGDLIDGYAKHHLVPFGEYVPLSLNDWLPIERLTEGLGDFTPGPGPKTLFLSGLPSFGVAICYEIIFPGHVVDDAERPEWIFNASNDAWFGNSIGPEQHLAAARMRAVEEGLPVVRAVNTGISAVIDATGNIVARLGLEKTGTIDATLPSALPRTLYARFGDWMLVPLVLATWFAGLGIAYVRAAAWPKNVERQERSPVQP